MVDNDDHHYCIYDAKGGHSDNDNDVDDDHNDYGDDYHNDDDHDDNNDNTDDDDQNYDDDDYTIIFLSPCPPVATHPPLLARH